MVPITIYVVKGGKWEPLQTVTPVVETPPSAAPPAPDSGKK
jgi:hypothetical protein